MPNCISLDHASVPLSMCDRQQMFINCLPYNDLEMRFQGTIFCEMDDLDQTPPERSLYYLENLEKRVIRAQFCISQTTFDCLQL